MGNHPDEMKGIQVPGGPGEEDQLGRHSLGSLWRRAIGPYVPDHIGDPLGLVRRTIQSGGQEGRAAVVYAGLGLMAWPLDLALSFLERARYHAADTSSQPIIIVVGPPRSGTTVIYQSLLKALPVSYFNNLTSVFPMSPITASALAHRPFRNQELALSSYYGRSSKWWGPNDGLYLWDRWFDAGRSQPKNSLLPENAAAMSQFFGAWAQAFGRPLVTKNNSLVSGAHLIAQVLAEAHFIYVDRHPVFLAQSLLRARGDMHGSDEQPYGLHDPDRPRDIDPIRDVANQIEYHTAMAAKQRSVVGDSRFWSVAYEDFCARPADLAFRVSEEILGLSLDRSWLDGLLPPMAPRNSQKVSDAEFKRIKFEIDRLGLNGL
jgi:hypothetical protein